MRAVLRTVGLRCRAAASAPQTAVLICGGAAGACLAMCWQLMLGQFGWSWASLTTGLAVILGSYEFAVRRVRIRLAIPVCLLTLATWTVSAPLLISLSGRLAGMVPLSVLGTSAGSLVFHAFVSMLLLGIPSAVAGMLARTSEVDFRTHGRSTWPLLLLGAATAILVQSLVLSPLVGVHLAATLCSAAAACGILLWGSSPAGDASSEALTSVESQSDSASPYWIRVAAACGLVLIGLLASCISRMADQLMPTSVLAAQVWAAAFVAGLAMGFRQQIRSDEVLSPTSRVVRGAILGACWFAVICAIFPVLVDLSLVLSSTVGKPWILIPARCLMVGVLATPLGVAAAWCCRGASATQSECQRPPLCARPLFWLIAGIAVSQAAFIASAGIRLTGTVSAVGLGIITTIVLIRSQAWPVTRIARTGLAAAAVLVLSTPWLSGLYRPDRSARLLFSTNVFTARQLGVERKYLTSLDDARLDGLVEGKRGTVTLWHARGAQIQIRTNGIPSGFLSRDSQVCPQYSGDILHVALPLTLHESPRRVMILGVGAGMPLLTTLSFPVQHAVCVEPDRSLVQLLSRKAWPQGALSPLADDRLTWRAIEPALAVAASSEPFDIILSTPPQSALASAAPEFTVEFYQRAARNLGSEGIFCQRFSHVDYGPEPLLILSKTLQQVFREVAVIEAAPGEVLLLGTMSEQGLVRSGFIERLQALHVRKTLSRAGWDWSVPLNLAAYDQKGLAALAEKSSSNTAANGRLASWLPWELVRWAPKWQETSERLTPKSTRLLAWSTIDATDPDLLSRLAEVAGQRNLMASYPDQPWAYRKTLREQLEKSSRSVIVQASGGAKREMHPDDRFRKNYFEALGLASQQADPSPERLDRLEEFTEPFDPLVSYFSHHELAELYGRKAAADPHSELRHRLHMAWYADPRDRSIRNIVRAIELLNREDAAQLETAEQWDQLNGLLQLLLGRWELRGRYKPLTTQVALNDIDKSLAAIEKSFETMERIGPEIGISDAEVQARRTVLERSLIRPLQTYRSRLLPKHLSEVRKTQKALEEAGVTEWPELQ